jgi:hypothetical protein
LQLDGSVYVRNIQVNFFCKIYGWDSDHSATFVLLGNGNNKC